MAKSNTQTVEQYIDGLPQERREAVSNLRQVILANLPDGYEEGMLFGVIAYYVPLERCAETYNGQPLMMAGLASRKNYMALYLMSVYQDKALKKWFIAGWKKSGKKLDMGKSCVRFRKSEDLPLDLIGRTIAKVPVEQFVASYGEA